MGWGKPKRDEIKVTLQQTEQGGDWGIQFAEVTDVEQKKLVESGIETRLSFDTFIEKNY